jgi:hypothetical protein
MFVALFNIDSRVDRCDGVACRAITSSQIARATEAERAEARSLSADRRRKLRLELGDCESISTLLENSMLAAEGELLYALDASCCWGSTSIGGNRSGRSGRPGSVWVSWYMSCHHLTAAVVLRSRWAAGRRARQRCRGFVPAFVAPAAADHVWSHSGLYRSSL